MRYKKGLIFICLIICFFSIASVVASDINETVVASEDQSDFVGVEETTDDVVSIYDNDINNTVISNENEEVLAVEDQEVNEIGATEENELTASSQSFSSLKDLVLNSYGELELTKDYKYCGINEKYNLRGTAIKLEKPIIINGNGHIKVYSL